MRRIFMTPPTDDVWRNWQRRCEQARDVLVASIRRGDSGDIDVLLYKETKHVFFMDYDYIFRGKCAYCERDIRNQHGDIEHFRPKKKVTDENDIPVTRVVNGKIEVHPGYYWLTYDWSNLLPSCIICNRPSVDAVGGRRLGKRNRFPVEGVRAWEPGGETHEIPLIIHPVFEDPENHLLYHRNGILGWQTRTGEFTVNILGLNDNGLPHRRRERYLVVRALAAEYIHARRFQAHRRAMELEKELRRIADGYGEFTSYARLAIRDECESHEASLRRLSNLIKKEKDES